MLLAGCGGGSHGGDPYDVAVTTLSAPPRYLSGGSALIRIATNAPASKSVIVKINGTDVSSTFQTTGTTEVVQGVATGMVTGSNTIAAKIGSRTSGFALRPCDNVGVRDGLAALSEGTITVDQFIGVNANIGGYDANDNYVTTRTVVTRARSSACNRAACNSE